MVQDKGDQDEVDIFHDTSDELSDHVMHSTPVGVGSTGKIPNKNGSDGRLKLVFSKYHFWWDRVGSDFSGWVSRYSRRWAIIGDSTKISTFTNLKHTQIMGSNHLLYFSSATFFAFKTVRHRRNVNQEKISVHSKHGCVHKSGVT